MAAAVAQPAGNGYPPIPSDLAGVERMCEQLYTAQDSDVRHHAESVLLSLATSTRHLPQCTMILDSSSVSPHPLPHCPFSTMDAYRACRIVICCSILVVAPGSVNEATPTDLRNVLPTIDLLCLCFTRTDALCSEVRRVDVDETGNQPLGANIEGGASSTSQLCLELSCEEGPTVAALRDYGAKHSVV